MTRMSHIRRFALIAVIGCAVLAGWTSAASASPAYDPIVPSAPPETRSVEPPASSTGGDLILPIVLGATVVLLVIGTAGYAHRTRPSRRTLA